MRVAVFGGAGFLGSHVADALSQAGHAVTVFDAKASPYLRPDQQGIVVDVFATLAPEIPMRSPDVDMICVGEGEYAIVDLATRMWKGQDYTTVKNLWVKKDGQVVKNPMNPPIPMDEVPFGDFDLFEKERFFRPMQGKIMRMAPIETDRGCPYKCRFCEAPSLVNIYREQTGQYYFRRRSWTKAKEEIEEYIRKYEVNYIYFNSDVDCVAQDLDKE